MRRVNLLFGIGSFNLLQKLRETSGSFNWLIIAIASDVFGEGIFLVDGDKWRQQRKLVSFEFSARVLRNFSCAVFRQNAAKFDLLMRYTQDSIFKVGIGVELNCLEGSSEEGTLFMKAFDDANALICWCFVNPF